MTGVSDIRFPMRKRHLKIEHEPVTSCLRIQIHCKGETIKITRSGGRWRWANGPLASREDIAFCLFDCPENPSNDHVKLIKDFVELWENVIDSAGTSYRQVAEQVRKDSTQAAEKHRNKKRNGSVKSDLYLMQHANGLTKIGRASNPKAREKTLQAEDPRLCLIFEASGKGYLEKNLHSQFEQYRIRGEWFNLSSDMVEWIKMWVNSI